MNITSICKREQGVSAAGPGASLPSCNEPTVDAMTQAYVEVAGGDTLLALRLAIADALVALDEMDRRTRQVERMVSRGFIRAGANAGHRDAP
jgi:hypothetical protein